MLDPLALERIGAFMDPADGQVKRHRVRNANFEYDPNDPRAELNGALLAYDQQLIPHAVILPLATDPASIKEAQQKAINAGADFYHPQHGWLRWGRKRETERPENLGAASVRYESRRVTLSSGQGSGSRVQGDEELVPPTPDTQDPEPDAPAPAPDTRHPTPDTPGGNPKPETQRGGKP